MNIDNWASIFNTIENKLTESGMLKTIKSRLLNAMKINNNSTGSGMLKIIKEKLKEEDKSTYEEWKNKGFDINYPFHVGGIVVLEDFSYYSIFRCLNISSGFTLLHLAAYYGYKDLVRFLLDEKNADLNLGNDYDPLCLATREGHLEIVKYLIDEKDVDPDLRYNSHTKPLHLAAERGHLEIVKYLIDEKNVDPDLRDCYGSTPLYYAAPEGHLEIVKYLIDEKNVGPNSWNRPGTYLLHLAVANNRLEIVKYLIDEKNVDPDLRDYAGVTPLHSAAANNCLEIVKYLIDEKNVDPDLRDNAGVTPLHLAARKGNLGIIKCITNGHSDVVEPSKVADVNTRDRNGNTPLRCAVDNGHKGSAKLLIAYEVKKDSNAQKPEYLENPDANLKREMSEYWDKCLDEIERMKQGKIYQGITLYDILVSKNNRLASYIRNESLMDVLEKSGYKSEFPIYANDLELQFKVGRQRLDDLNIGETVTIHFDDFMERMGPFNLRIAEYLNNKDLKNLEKAAVQTMDEGDCKLEIREEIPKSLSNLNVENLNEVVRSARRA